MRGCAKPVETEASRIACLLEGPPSYQPSTQQRRCFNIIQFLRKRERKASVGTRLRCIAAVPGVSGECRPITQIFAARFAEVAVSACAAEPGYADAVAHREIVHLGADPDHPSDNLVTGHDRKALAFQIAIDDMQVGSADSTRGHGNDDFSGAGR
jgi:hypothetical protein